MSIGYIPNEVHFYLRAPSKPPYDVPTVREIREAWPVNGRLGKSAAIHAKAKSWAENVRYDPTTKKPLPIPPEAGEEVRTRNTPRRGYRLVGSEVRTEGGRVWKVLTPDDYLVDLREDVFLPILLSRGVPKGPLAEIDTEFQWCVSGSQIRLEEVGSDQHQEYLTEKEQFCPQTSRGKTMSEDLVVGGVYAPLSKGGRPLIYLGKARYDGKQKFAFVELAPMWRVYQKPDPSVKDTDPSTFQERADFTLRRTLKKEKHCYEAIRVKSRGAVGGKIGEVQVTLDPKASEYFWQRTYGVGSKEPAVEWL